jgi:3-deoxy-D-manno-octulosonic-acid transferase
MRRMRFGIVLVIYRLLLPVFLAAAFPGWLVKMARRGGFGSGLGERITRYREAPDFEPCGTAHLHAISVGEAMLALKLIRAWLVRSPGKRFVLAVGTATGHAIALENAPPGVRVVYAPLDLMICVRRYLDRFEPSQIVLVEGEAWPNLLVECRRRGIPVRLVNARMSPRSERRYRKLAGIVGPLFSLLDRIAVQETDDIPRWTAIGPRAGQITCTGSLKFDPGTAPPSRTRPEFAAMLDAFGPGRPVVLLASSHAGEERLITRVLLDSLSTIRLVIVPRHAERRHEVLANLASLGVRGILRSSFHAPETPEPSCLIVDSTGELRDWTAHADIVVIGKSFFGTGGQNPAEAILAGKPVAFGPHMENFEPLASRLVETRAVWHISDPASLGKTIRDILGNPSATNERTTSARALLEHHAGATERTLDLLDPPDSPPL